VPERARCGRRCVCRIGEPQRRRAHIDDDERRRRRFAFRLARARRATSSMCAATAACTKRIFLRWACWASILPWRRATSSSTANCKRAAPRSWNSISQERSHRDARARLKGPLTHDRRLRDVLAEDERFDEESRKFLTMISSSAMRLASLATDTLALSRLEQNELTLRTRRVRSRCAGAATSSACSASRARSICAPTAKLHIGGDPGRLRQVFEE